MSLPVLAATLMRPSGETGVQTHTSAFLAAAAEGGVRARRVTPFDLHPAIVYPAFAPGALLRPVSEALWVAWYRESHFRALRDALVAALRREGPCIVYAQDPLSARAGLEARDRGLAAEVVMAVHFNVSQADEWANRGSIRRGGRIFRRIAALEEDVIPRVDRLVYTSEFARDAVRGRIPAAAAVPSWCVPNFTAAADGSPPRTGDLLSIGTLEPRKNQGFLLDVLAECHRRGRPFRLTLAGDGPIRRELERRTTSLGLADHVTFLGYRADAAALLATHRACVHSARMENLPLVLLEALAAGTPVFAAGVGGIPEVFDDGVEGVRWDLGDPAASADALISALDSPARWEAMSRAARLRHARRFSAEVVFPRLLEAVLGNRRLKSRQQQHEVRLRGLHQGLLRVQSPQGDFPQLLQRLQSPAQES